MVQTESGTESETRTDATPNAASVIRVLPESEWERAHPLLAAAFPGRAIELDPDSQRLVVLEDPAGTVQALAIVSTMFHVSYVTPNGANGDAENVRLDVLQSVAEAQLPPKTVYYTLVQDNQSAEQFESQLGMQKCSGIVVYAKQRNP